MWVNILCIIKLKKYSSLKQNNISLSANFPFQTYSFQSKWNDDIVFDVSDFICYLKKHSHFIEKIKNTFKLCIFVTGYIKNINEIVILIFKSFTFCVLNEHTQPIYRKKNNTHVRNYITNKNRNYSKTKKYFKKH